MKVSTYTRIKNAAINTVGRFKSGEIDTCRVGTKIWKHILINNMDKFFADSELHTLTAKHLGVGVYEISISGD